MLICGLQNYYSNDFWYYCPDLFKSDREFLNENLIHKKTLFFKRVLLLKNQLKFVAKTGLALI